MRAVKVAFYKQLLDEVEHAIMNYQNLVSVLNVTLTGRMNVTRALFCIFDTPISKFF